MSDERPSDSPTAASKGKRRRRERRRRRVPGAEHEQSRRPRILFWLAIVFGAAVAAAAMYFLVFYPRSAGPGAGKDVEITLERDEPLGSVISKLERAGLLGSRPRFSIYVRLVSPTFAPGAHLLTDDVTPEELVHRLERLGHASKAKVTIPEGFTRFDIAKRLQNLHVTSAAVFLEATTDGGLLRELAIDGGSTEGFLFPATYDLPKDSDARDVIRRLKAEFDRRYGMLEQNHRMGIASLEALGWSRREIVTLASIVEKEAAVDDERPIIASVFLNRLRDPKFKRKLLQSDPTSGYGCLVLREKIPSCAQYSGKITHAINVDPENPYSTYVHEGLPPGPIANPGLPALQAVLAPANTKFLYFVTRAEAHRHAFSETLEEHNAAVKDLRERTHRDRP